jgi:hypothetical protein
VAFAVSLIEEIKEQQAEIARLEPISLEEIRRQARENWLRLRQRMVSDEKRTRNES